MDLNKLSPAPWATEPPLNIETPGWCREADMFENQAFIALARNAFDVMMRRNWWAVAFSRNEESDKAWHVSTFCVPIEMRRFVASQFCDNPFTALIEADRWMKEQEAK